MKRWLCCLLTVLLMVGCLCGCVTENYSEMKADLCSGTWECTSGWIAMPYDSMKRIKYTRMTFFEDGTCHLEEIAVLDETYENTYTYLWEICDGQVIFHSEHVDSETDYRYLDYHGDSLSWNNTTYRTTVTFRQQQ